MRFDDFFSSLAVMHHEASKLQTLTHPNIVRVFDCDRDAQTVFMTMEYLDGTPLKFIIKKAADGVPERAIAMRIIESMVAALEFAHAKHIVHGDLKPGNVIVTKTGEVKVIDFGIARFLRKPHEPDEKPHDDLPGDYHRVHAALHEPGDFRPCRARRARRRLLAGLHRARIAGRLASVQPRGFQRGARPEPAGAALEPAQGA